MGSGAITDKRKMGAGLGDGRGERSVTTEAEIGAMQLLAEEGQQPPEAREQ